MLRIHFALPDARPYLTQDLVHDALVAGFLATGLRPDQVIGRQALPYTFACHARRGQFDPQTKKRLSWLEGVTVSTPDPLMAEALQQLMAEHILAARALAGEMLTLQGATKQTLPCPIAPGQQSVGVYWLSPVLNQVPHTHQSEAFLFNPLEVEQLDPGLGLSRRLARPVALRWMADRLSVRTERHRTDTALKVLPDDPNKVIWLPGTTIPFVLSGSTEDLQLAWYAGLGKKTRMGFGCWDTQPALMEKKPKQGARA